jgi:hypothetical protein
MLNDFCCDPDAVCQVLELTLNFWNQSQAPKIQERLFGALHWHLLAQSYENPFESFMAQYMVLDACWSVHKEVNSIQQEPKHPKRVEEMASTYGLDLPEWARTDSKGRSELSRLRNELVHEAKWAGLPIGFSHPETEAIDYELAQLNARLLLVILGWKNPYVHSRPQMGIEHNVRGTKDT